MAVALFTRRLFTVWLRPVTVWLGPVAACLSLSSLGAQADNVSEVPDNGCQCLWQGSFAEVAPTTDLVVIGEVVELKGNAVDLQVERTLLGEAWQPTLRVWMQARDYCRPKAERFGLGSRWLMALQKIREVPDDGFDPTTPNISFGRPYDYSLSICGGYFLRAAGNTVTGNLVPDMPRWAFKPEMSPVLVDLVASYLQGRVSADVLKEASREDPSVKALILDTRSFLRGQDRDLEQDIPH